VATSGIGQASAASARSRPPAPLLACVLTGPVPAWTNGSASACASLCSADCLSVTFVTVRRSDETTVWWSDGRRSQNGVTCAAVDRMDVGRGRGSVPCLNVDELVAIRHSDWNPQPERGSERTEDGWIAGVGGFNFLPGRSHDGHGRNRCLLVPAGSCWIHVGLLYVWNLKQWLESVCTSNGIET
jgi:hypothetical protein